MGVSLVKLYADCVLFVCTLLGNEWQLRLTTAFFGMKHRSFVPKKGVLVHGGLQFATTTCKLYSLRVHLFVYGRIPYALHAFVHPRLGLHATSTCWNSAQTYPTGLSAPLWACSVCNTILGSECEVTSTVVCYYAGVILGLLWFGAERRTVDSRRAGARSHR